MVLKILQKLTYYGGGNHIYYTNLRTISTRTIQYQKYSRENVRNQVQGYVFTRYIDYVKNYDKLLESKFPAAMHVYRVFLIGVKDFYNDIKKYIKVSKIVNESPMEMRALTRKEIELYYKMPKDMWKVAPVLLISALPFANYVVFPIAYMYPRIFLTSHFWSIQQKLQFQETYLRQRLTYNRKVFRYLQANLHLIKNETYYEKWKLILGLLGSGLHPTSEEILIIKELFTKQPYKLENLTSKHLKYLCGLHGIPKGLFKYNRLAEHAYVLHHMDLAIKREGGVHNMPSESLRDACYIRGLNTSNLNNEDMIQWLSEWVKVSSQIDGTNISLFLHLPILISYNHPNNWRLTYR